MALTIKAAGSPSSTALATAEAEYDSGSGAVVFQVDLSTLVSQEEDFTACYLQLQYEIDTFQYLTTLLDVSLINNYS